MTTATARRKQAKPDIAGDPAAWKDLIPESNGKPEQAPAPDAAEGGSRLLPLARIVPSPTNPRRHFDEAKLAELAESIRSKGVLQPILVRSAVGWTTSPGKLDGKPGWLVENVPALIQVPELHRTQAEAQAAMPRYELIAGERRFRAARLAGLAVIPAVVRELSDREVLEVQVIENEQREDVTPLEKADGYAALVEKHKVEPETLALRIGKSVSTIRGLLKLRQLPPLARRALAAGVLPVQTAQLIARVPGEKSREEVTRYVLCARHWGSPPKAPEAEEALAGGGSPMSYRDTKDLIEERYTVELKGCQFDRLALDLVQSAGSCEACPKRGGNLVKAEPDAYAGTRGDVCTDPECFRSKEAAHRKRLADSAKAKGLTVLDAKTCAKVFSRYSSLPGALIHESPYVNLAHVCPEDKKGRTWKELVGDELQGSIVVGFDPENRPWNLVLKTMAVGAARNFGIKAKAEPAARTGQSWERQQEAMRRKREAEHATKVALLAPVAEKAERIAREKLLADGTSRANSPALKLLRQIVLAMIPQYSNANTPVGAAAKRRGLTPTGTEWQQEYANALRGLAETLDGPGLVGLLAELAAGEDLFSNACNHKRVGALLGLLGVDRAAIEAQAKAALKAERKLAKAAGRADAGDGQGEPEDLDEEGGDE